MWLEVDRSTWSVLFQRKPTSERRSRGVLTKGAENKAEAIALHVAGNSFRPLKCAFLPACFSPSSPRLGAAHGIEIYTRKTCGAVRTLAQCRSRNTHSDSSSQFTPSLFLDKSLSEISCRVHSFFSSYISAFQSPLTGRLCGESR